MSYPVLTRLRGGVAHLRLNRPTKLNVIDVEMAEGIRDGVEIALSEPTTRVILLSGEGRSFAAGGDLSSFRAAEDKSALANSIIGPIHQALKRLVEAPAITLCAVQGNVAGAGVSIAAFADLAIAADNATFNLAYARVATSPDCGASWSLPRLLGTRKALEFALLSDTIDAEEALRLGLVNRVVPTADLLTSAEQMADRLASHAPAALAHTKVLMRQASNTTAADHLDAEQRAFSACASTEDFVQALEAFFQKRPVTFRGR